MENESNRGVPFYLLFKDFNYNIEFLIRILHKWRDPAAWDRKVVWWFVVIFKAEEEIEMIKNQETGGEVIYGWPLSN